MYPNPVAKVCYDGNMRERRNWWAIADGDWHRVDGAPEGTRSTLSAWGGRHGYKASTQLRPDGLYVRLEARAGAPDEALRARLAAAQDGNYLEVPRSLPVRLRPAQWFVLLEAGRSPDGIPPVRHLNGKAVNSLVPRYLTGFHKSLTAAGLRLLDREEDARRLEQVGAECLADLTDSTFRPL